MCPTVHILLFDISTVTLTVGCRFFLFRTVGRDLGRQFISLIVYYKLSKPLKIAVQKPKGVVHTAVSKEDFPKLTVEKAKISRKHCNFYCFSQPDDSRIGKTTSAYCNLSWNVLKNGSSKNHFWIRYCHSKLISPRQGHGGIIIRLLLLL